jgi:signal transduction histidine kinase
MTLNSFKKVLHVELDSRLKTDNPKFYNSFVTWWGKNLKQTIKEESLWQIPELKINSVLNEEKKTDMGQFVIGVMNTNLDMELNPQFKRYSLVIDEFEEINLSELIKFYIEVEKNKLIHDVLLSAIKIKKNPNLKNDSSPIDQNIDSALTLFDINWSKIEKFKECKVIAVNEIIGHKKGKLVSLDSKNNFFIWFPISFEIQNDDQHLQELILKLNLLVDRTREVLFFDQKIDELNIEIESISEPFLYMTNNGHFFHSKKFLDLNISINDCLKSLENTIVNIKTNKLLLHKSQLINDETLVWFEELKNEEKSYNEELGVISSSLAHELNNPIAGMLAACSVLKLDLNPSQEEFKLVENMINSLERCKELIQTLLGFSKYTLITSVSGVISAKESSERAANLIKPRLLENNLKMQIDFIFHNKFTCKNSNMLIIYFYMILSEYLTIINRQRLLGEELTVLKISFKENEKGLSYNCQFQDELEKVLTKNKLFNYIVLNL